MNFPGTSSHLPFLRILFLVVYIIPLWAHGQAPFAYTKNKWQQNQEGLFLKKMGIYSPYENIFFLKKAEKKPSHEETWVIFGGEEGEFVIHRDSNFKYYKASLLYGQEEISISRDVGSKHLWTLKSESEYIYLNRDEEESANSLCRLFRTMQVTDPADSLKGLKEVEIMSLSADKQSLKKSSVEDFSYKDKRFIPYKIMAVFLYVSTLAAEEY